MDPPRIQILRSQEKKPKDIYQTLGEYLGIQKLQDFEKLKTQYLKA